jgi:hypothetical protein
MAAMMNNLILNVIPPEILEMIALEPRTFVIVVTDEIISQLQSGETSTLKLENAPLKLVVFIPLSRLEKVYGKEWSQDGNEKEKNH